MYGTWRSQKSQKICHNNKILKREIYLYLIQFMETLPKSLLAPLLSEPVLVNHQSMPVGDQIIQIKLRYIYQSFQLVVGRARSQTTMTAQRWMIFFSEASLKRINFVTTLLHMTFDNLSFLSFSFRCFFSTEHKKDRMHSASWKLFIIMSNLSILLDSCMCHEKANRRSIYLPVCLSVSLNWEKPLSLKAIAHPFYLLVLEQRIWQIDRR